MARTSFFFNLFAIDPALSPPVIKCQHVVLFQGAATTCYVATSPSLKGVSGKYFANCRETKPSAQAENDDLARKLWEESEVLLS